MPNRHWQFHLQACPRTGHPNSRLPAEHTLGTSLKQNTHTSWVIKNEINFLLEKHEHKEAGTSFCKKLSNRNQKNQKLAGRCLVRKWALNGRNVCWTPCVCARKARLISCTNCSHSNAPAHREKIIEHWQRPYAGEETLGTHWSGFEQIERV